MRILETWRYESLLRQLSLLGLLWLGHERLYVILLLRWTPVLWRGGIYCEIDKKKEPYAARR